MAQHIPIDNTTNKNMKKVFISISKKFNNFGVSKIKSSLKYQEIYDDIFKTSPFGWVDRRGLGPDR